MKTYENYFEDSPFYTGKRRGERMKQKFMKTYEEKALVYQPRSIGNIMIELETATCLEPDRKYILLYPRELSNAIQEQKEIILKEIDKLIVDEILICHKENTPTSRLTSLAMKLKKL